MKLAKNVPSVWPGYVAAIASLVLSLLLLLAILVFALTQVGNLVSNYREAIMKAVLAAERFRTSDVAQPIEKETTTLNPQALARPPAPRPLKAIGAESTLYQITLIFSAGLADIPEQEKLILESAIQKTPLGGESNWRIWSTTYVNDPVMERATFLLMLAARRTLVAQGISEKKIELQLSKSETAPANYLLGEIVVNVAPVPNKANTWRQP
jgi:hypothetical protein